MTCESLFDILPSDPKLPIEVLGLLCVSSHSIHISQFYFIFFNCKYNGRNELQAANITANKKKKNTKLNKSRSIEEFNLDRQLIPRCSGERHER